MNFLAIALVLSSARTSFYVGTYTFLHGSHGIYRMELDERTGSLSAPVLVAEATNPSYLALKPNRSELFAVDESTSGSVSGYRIRGDGSLQLMSQQPVPGAAP